MSATRATLAQHCIRVENFFRIGVNNPCHKITAVEVNLLFCYGLRKFLNLLNIFSCAYPENTSALLSRCLRQALFLVDNLFPCDSGYFVTASPSIGKAFTKHFRLHFFHYGRSSPRTRLFPPIRNNNRGISVVERLRIPVTDILIVGLQHD